MSGSLAHGLLLQGVVGDPPSRQQIANERFGRHDAMDQPMLAAARLACAAANRAWPERASRLPMCSSISPAA